MAHVSIPLRISSREALSNPKQTDEIKIATEDIFSNVLANISVFKTKDGIIAMRQNTLMTFGIW